MVEPVSGLEAIVCCPLKPPLAERPLLADREAGRLAALFRVLANGTRLRLLHALVRAGELSPTELSAALGMKPQAVSNQLQVGRARRVRRYSDTRRRRRARPRHDGHAHVPG